MFAEPIFDPAGGIYRKEFSAHSYDITVDLTVPHAFIVSRKTCEQVVTTHPFHGVALVPAPEVAKPVVKAKGGK
jgi:hypothetical protein